MKNTRYREKKPHMMMQGRWGWQIWVEKDNIQGEVSGGEY